jgi:hypothetical protein
MSDAYNQGPAMMAARGQTYGKRKEQMDAQRAVPMGKPPTEPNMVRPRPAAPGSLTAPSQRPTEPITAGAPFGTGPNPMAAGIPMMAPAVDEAVNELRQIAQVYRSDELMDLLDAYESQT